MSCSCRADEQSLPLSLGIRLRFQSLGLRVRFRTLRIGVRFRRVKFRVEVYKGLGLRLQSLGLRIFIHISVFLRSLLHSDHAQGFKYEGPHVDLQPLP